MTKDLANIGAVKRGLDDINLEIQKLRRWIDHFIPENAFEEEAYEAYNNSLERLLVLRYALEKKLVKYGKS